MIRDRTIEMIYIFLWIVMLTDESLLMIRTYVQKLYWDSVKWYDTIGSFFIPIDCWGAEKARENINFSYQRRISRGFLFILIHFKGVNRFENFLFYINVFSRNNSKVI